MFGYVGGKYEEDAKHDNRQDLTTEVMITRWNDNSVVTMVSNCRGIEPLGMAKGWLRTDKKSIDIIQPFVIDQYRWNRGRVDRVDQNISRYQITFQSGHISGGGHSSHTFFMSPCKAHD